MKRIREPLGRSKQLVRRELLTVEERNRHVRVEAPPKRKHTALWCIVAVLSLIGTAACGLVMLEVSRGEKAFFAVIDGEIVRRDDHAVSAFRAAKAEEQRLRSEQNGIMSGGTGENDAARWPTLASYQGRFTPGIFIDGLDVSGMTVEEARAALLKIPAEGGGEFSVTVNVSGTIYTIGSDRVPMTRNIDEVLQSAWIYAWEDMPCTDLSGANTLRPAEQLEGETPFETRLRSLRESRAGREEALDETEALLKARAEQPVHFQTELTYDRAAIRVFADDIAAASTVEPVDAEIVSFDTVTLGFTVAPDHDGTSLDGEQVCEAVLACLDRGDLYGTVYITPEVTHAAVTGTELAARLGRISTFTTKTTSNANRNTNIRISANAINGHCVMPGESFSFNMTVGRRSERQGYKPAPAISGGQSVDEVGGGVCQTSSTLFNAVARGNFEIVSRSPHAWPSSYVEKGMDATVDWQSPDFVWRNNTEYPVWIWAHYEDRQITVSLYGVTLGDGVYIDLESVVVETIPAPVGIARRQNPELPAGTSKQVIKPRPGYKVETWQVWKRDGYELSRNLLCTSTYKAYQETWEYN